MTAGKKDEIVPTGLIRNVGIVAHIDAGKTTLTERILYESREISHMGEVHEGTTVTDWMPQERERGISISAAAVSCRWKQWRINVVDTPGHIDFTAEVERSLAVMDGIVAVFCAVKGVQSQSETVWRRARRQKLPALVFINKMDRDGASPDRVVTQITERLKVKAVPVQYPVGSGAEFSGIVDLFDGAYHGKADADTLKNHEFDIELAKENLVESLAEVDDVVLSKYLYHQEISGALLKQAMRRSVIKRKLVPVFFGSSLLDIGVDELLDGVGEFLPMPTERVLHPEIADDSVLCAMVFRVVATGGTRMVYIRLFGGELQNGARLVDTRTGVEAEVSSVLRVQASEVLEAEKAVNGGIVAIEGSWRGIRTGDILAAPGANVRMPSMHFPQPVVSVNIEAVERSMDKMLEMAAKYMTRDDPTLKARRISGSVGWTFYGMGELHLEIVRDRLKSDYGIDTRAGEPRVEYRSTVSGKASAKNIFEKKFPNGVFISAGVEVQVEPLENGSGLKFDMNEVERCLPDNQAKAVRQGIMSVVNAESSGFPMTDIKVTVLGAFSNAGDASEPALVAASRGAMDNAIAQAGKLVLEPLMKLEVNTPGDTLGNVMADLNARHANVSQIDSFADGLARIVALVPLADLFGYASSLRSMSAGRGEVVAEPDSYRVRAKH